MIPGLFPKSDVHVDQMAKSRCNDVRGVHLHGRASSDRHDKLLCTIIHWYQADFPVPDNAIFDESSRRA